MEKIVTKEYTLDMLNERTGIPVEHLETLGKAYLNIWGLYEAKNGNLIWVDPSGLYGNSLNVINEKRELTLLNESDLGVENFEDENLKEAVEAADEVLGKFPWVRDELYLVDPFEDLDSSDISYFDGESEYKGFLGYAEVNFKTGKIMGRAFGEEETFEFEGATIEEAEADFKREVDARVEGQ